MKIQEAIQKFIGNNREAKLTDFSIAEIRSLKHLVEQANSEEEENGKTTNV